MKKILKNLYLQIILCIIIFTVIYYLLRFWNISFQEIINEYFGLIAFILIGLILIFFIKARKEDDSKISDLYSHLATFLQTFFAIFAIWYAVSESKDNNEQFKTNLSKQNTLIDKQDALIELQKKLSKENIDALKTIGDASGKLVTNLEVINKIVEGMPSKIDGVTASFAILTEYSKVEAERLEEESSKKSDLYVVSINSKRSNFFEGEEGVYELSDIKLWNKGSIEGKLVKIEFYFDTTYVSYVQPQNISSTSPAYKDGQLAFTFDFADRNYVVAAYDKNFEIYGEIILRLRPGYFELSSFSLKYNIIFSDKNSGRYNEGNYTVQLK